jgi:NAD(P)-dependent dehydrogenase (short-subunit alcohol dehydrogenase family)
MAAAINGSPVQREQDLLGQTVLVIGGSSGIGLETARLARAKGADIILTARNPDRLHRAGLELGASIAAFDATDFDRLERFFDALPTPIDHLLVTGPRPYYAPLAEFDLDAARRDVDAHLLLPLQVARHAATKVRPPGTLRFIGGTGRRTAAGLSLITALTAALPAMTKTLALEIAPVRVNLIAARAGRPPHDEHRDHRRDPDYGWASARTLALLGAAALLGLLFIVRGMARPPGKAGQQRPHDPGPA